jgi:phenylpyruvate tautomerase PptA (4-oxalocrotonate tautomerase family)
MCDIYIPQNALDPEAERALVARVTDLLVYHELRRIVDLADDPGEIKVMVDRARSIAWTFVHRADTYVAGTPIEAPHYKFVVSIPQGQIDDAFIPAANKEILAAVADAEHDAWPHPERRVWVFVHEILDGTWGAGGTQLHLEQIVDFVAPGWGKIAEQRWENKRRALGDAASLPQPQRARP